MRLPTLKRGHAGIQRLIFSTVRRFTGYVPGPMMVMSYRRDFFGKAFSQLLDQGLCKMRHWSAAEVELFAAFVAKQNACTF